MNHHVPRYPDDLVRASYVGDARRHRIDGASELYSRASEAYMQEVVDVLFNGASNPQHRIIVAKQVR